MTVDPPRERLARWWGGLRVFVLVVWLFAAVASWWTAPRQAGYDVAKAAVAEKSLTAYQWGDSWGHHSWYGWFGDSTLRSTGTLGPVFAWRLGDGRVRWADAEDFDEVVTTGTVDRDDYSGPGATAIAQELTAAGLTGRTGAVDTTNGWITGAGIVLALVLLGVVIAGPAPVRGTRWYWFWLTLTTAYGLGLVFWLFRDRPWSRTAGGGTRDRGWRGLLIGILSSVLLSVAAAGLRDRWVP